MKRMILALGVTAAIATPVLADDYYIVHGPDKHCRVVERVPEDHTFIRVGPLSFKSRDEAERQLKVVCRDNGSYREEREEREERRERRY